MAMPRDLPFVVRLRFRKYTQALRNFTLDPRQANIDETSLLEYVPCTLEFAAVSSPPPSDARLYIDGFDALVDADNVLKVDDDRVYLPCGASMHIQGSDAQPGDHFSDDESNYPWIPGNYRVEVQWDGQTYHTVLCVKPKNLNDEQLRLMRVELEEHVVGLTLDIIRKNQGIGRGEFATELPLRFYQYQLLQKNFWTIDAALQDILRKPKQEVRRAYDVVPIAKSTQRDHRAYRWAHSAVGYARNHGQQERSQQFALVPTSAVHYDLPENRWVRRILENLLDITDDITVAIRRFTGTTDSAAPRLDEEKNKLIRDIGHIQSRLRSVLAHSMFRDVASVRGPLPYTPAMQRDGRYRTLYKFWWDLLNHSEVRVDASFEYQWKRTDLLWEYWTLVKTIQALQKLGFEPVSGWIFDKNWRFPERILIPAIPEGTKVTMVRGDEQIIIYYEERIPHFIEEAIEQGSLLYVEGPHNWPDIRLDYFRSGSYVHSFVVEAKYRPARNIWRDDRARDRRGWTKIMNQLQSYRSSVGLVADSMHRAVREVIAVYPSGCERPPVSKVSHSITLIRLTPGGSDEHYVEHFGELLGRGTSSD